MTDREKLIELLICADDYEVTVCKEYPCRVCKYRGDDCTYNAKASYLISHGVTFATDKNVGDNQIDFDYEAEG